MTMGQSASVLIEAVPIVVYTILCRPELLQRYQWCGTCVNTLQGRSTVQEHCNPTKQIYIHSGRRHSNLK